MVKTVVTLWLILTIITLIDAKCMIQGVCGGGREHVCHPSHISYTKVSPTVNGFCGNFPLHSDACCSDDQVNMIRNGLNQAQRWFGGRCYDLMREMFCNIHCSPKQHSFISDVKTDHEKVTSFTVNVTEQSVNKLFDACKDITFFFIRLVNRVCLKQPCDAKEFVRSLGTCRSNGGKSPYQINFNFI